MTKDISECHVHIHDAGTFIPLAKMFSKKAKRTSYYSPFEQEYLGVERCVIGDGIEGFERCDEYMDPEFFASVDLWVFPDIGYGGFQRYLRSLGKLVWGSFGASDLELYRTRFAKIVKELGLLTTPTVPIRGLTALTEHLKPLKNKWVKINRYRDNKETFKWIDWDHGQRDLEKMAFDFGPLKDKIVFVVQDPIEGDDDEPVLEVGYDGWLVTIDGEACFPESCYSGYERKNQLYLGSMLKYNDLPEEVRAVNEQFGKVNAQYGYRNFFATEIRIKGDKFDFIDPTQRMAGQTQEHLLKSCRNLPELILAGASGQMVKPEWEAGFAAEATLHYTAESEGWKTFKVPKEAEPWVMMYRCCCDDDGLYQFPPHKSDELGVVVGNGDSVQEAVDDLKDHFELLKDEPVSIEVAGFASLIDQIQKAEEVGVEFSDKPLPSPEIALDIS